MKRRITLATVSVLLGGAAGCAERAEPAAPTQRHPASPTAAEAPAPAASNTLKPDLDPDGAAPGGAPAPADDALATPAAYTCPHHPRVMEAEPGDCPTCGMPLEATTSRQTSPLRQRNDLPEAGTPDEPADDADADEAPSGADDEPGGQG